MTTTDTPAIEWTEIGAEILPTDAARTYFADLIGGRNEEWGEARWHVANGSHPFSPGMALNTIVTEFKIRPSAGVSYNLAYECHDTTLRPGPAGGYTATYTALGLRTRKQTIWFIDTGLSIYPVLIVNDGPHEPLTD